MSTIKLTEFGKLVRKWRIDADATLGDMARAMGISTTYLSAVEVGRKPLTDSLIEKAQEFLAPRVEDFSHKLLQKAADKTRSVVSVESLTPGNRHMVAAFARKLNEGETFDDIEKFRQFLKQGRD